MKRFVKDRERSGVDDAVGRVAMKVMCAPDATHVVSVGPIYCGSGWVVEVGIDPYNEGTGALIQEMVAPDQVVVTHQPRPEYPDLLPPD